MKKEKTPAVVAKKIQELSEKRAEIARMEPEKALKAIFDAPVPEALIQSFPPEDLYFLVKQLGYDDALDLLTWASNRQWEFLVDMEVWQKDTLNEKEVGALFARLLEADPKRLARWISTEKKELFGLYLYRTVDVRIREHDQDPSDFGENYFTFDDVMYFQAYADPVTDAERIKTEDVEKFLKTLFSQFLEEDINSVRNHVWEAKFILPAEEEEEAYRLRNVRLAENGFLPFEEAIGLYQAIRPEEFEKKAIRKERTFKKAADLSLVPVPQFFAGMFSFGQLFVKALSNIQDVSIWQELQMEFAALSNRIIVADQVKIEQREDLFKAVQKAVGYLDIGLEIMGKQILGFLPQRCIEEYALIDIFRVGYFSALELKWKADAFRKNNKFPLPFWGEKGMGILGGLFLKHPLFYDEKQKGKSLYRDFWTLEEIKETEKEIEKIIVLSEMFKTLNLDRMGAPVWVSWQALLLTHFAFFILSQKDSQRNPLTEKEIRRFLSDIFETKEKDLWQLRREVPKKLISWLEQQGIIITPLMEEILTDMWKEVAEALQHINPASASGRFVPYLISEEGLQSS